MKPKDVSLFSLVLGLVVLSFIGASGYVRHRTQAINQAALEISENASPSIMYVSKARVEVQTLALLVERQLDQADAGGVPSLQDLAASQARLHRVVRRYQSLPLFPDEHWLWDDANCELLHVDEALGRFITLLTARQLKEARTLASGELAEACRRTGDALLRTIEFDAQRVRDGAQRIRQMHDTVNHSSWLLNLLCVLWTAVALVGLGYSYRHRVQLREEQQRLALARAAELEQFAGRVAHDILNPLSVVIYALGGLERATDEEQRTLLIARGRANAKRVAQILDGLLKFAWAGAHPEPGAHVGLGEVMGDLEGELRMQAAEAGIELSIEPFAPCSAACSPGILISLVSNLAHNAIKYIRDGAGRRIILRVLPRKGTVRVEVQDNGPGLPPDLERVVFHPFVRGKTGGASGFGLGLATVKKAAEAHGGKVGVRSVLGQGCLFWFELPTWEPEPSPEPNSEPSPER